MGSGPRRIPTATLKLHGTLDKREANHRAQEPIPTGSPEKPTDLKGEAATYWDDYVPGLVQTGVAKKVDTPALIAMCNWWAEYLKHMRSRPKEDGAYRRINMMANAHKQWRDMASRFGMTPSDRANLSVKENESLDPADEFIA